MSNSVLRAAPLFLAVILTLAAPACTSPPGSRPAPQAAPVTEVVADWDDAEAAVAVALSRSELVLVRLDRPAPDRLEYTLRTSRDEPASLTIKNLASPGSPDPVPLRLTCSVGRFGDEAREAAFVSLVIARLEQLRGVETAPLD